MIAIRLSGQTRNASVLRDGALELHTWRGLAPAAEALIESLPAEPGGPVFVARDPLAPVTLAAAAIWPTAEILRHDFDAWEARLARENLEAHPHTQGAARVSGVVLADFPEVPRFALAALALPGRGEALLGKECLEMAHDLLLPDGRLFASTDGSPRWLLEKVREVFGRGEVHGRALSRGAVVTARRTRPAARHKVRAHPIRFAWGGRDFVLGTRPGVFSSRHLDEGTSALLEVMDPQPGEAVLDLGCGAGPLGLAAATIADADRTVLVDSNARAVDLARQNALDNGLVGVQTLLRADLERLPAKTFDLALANPPYYAQGRIAEAFARAAAAALKPSGRLFLVAKEIKNHREILQQNFRRVEVMDVRGYGVQLATGPREFR